MAGARIEEATRMIVSCPSKGVAGGQVRTLRADESTGTIGKRFAGVGLENTEENCRAYRSLLATSEGLGEYISGMILYEETLFQDAVGGTPIVEHIQRLGIVPGIKVDLGARFAKWRWVLRISAEGAPSALAVRENAWGLARYARTVQEAGLVPIVEPEILMDGDHDIATTAAAQERVLRAVYAAMAENGVLLEGSLLKPSMTTAGVSHDGPQSPEQVAEMTVRTMRRTVPAAVPGILFLSGGLGEEEASVYLDAINQADRHAPWHLGFSYGRALQHSCLLQWRGHDVAAGQRALMARARANSEASLGAYRAGSQPSDGERLFVAGYTN